MFLRAADFRAMQTHVARAAPEEACGLVAGRGGKSTAVFPITNVLHSPTAYRMAPDEQVRALFAMEARGEELLAIYHSHPGGLPTPSRRDLAEAAYAVVYLIWAPVGGTWVVRGFRLEGEKAQEVPVRVGV